jgi:hypothetical protein
MNFNKMFKRKTNKIPKRITERIHFKQRVKQRFGISLLTEDINVIIKKIQNNELELVEKQSNTKLIYYYYFNYERAKIVYDTKRKELVTVLYENK